MPQIASYEDVLSTRKHRVVPGGHHWRTDFLSTSEAIQDAPVAFLAEGTPARVTRPHFHDVDQFQVIVKGDGVLGKHHSLPMHAVHFTRALTPYGPIVAGKEGLGFLTLRAQWDQGAQYLPESREKLKQLPNRKPWQVTELPDFHLAGAAQGNVHAFSQIKDERGLGAFSMSLASKATALAPSPATSGGQYIIVTKGSLIYQAKEYNSVSVAFLTPSEAPLQIVAGPEGLEVLILNYPRREPIAEKARIAKSSHYRIWQCALCEFSYDEERGMPEEGIAAGTRWEDVPETWSCPDCAASKSDFAMQVVSG